MNPERAIEDVCECGDARDEHDVLPENSCRKCSCIGFSLAKDYLSVAQLAEGWTPENMTVERAIKILTMYPEWIPANSNTHVGWEFTDAAMKMGAAALAEVAALRAENEKLREGVTPAYLREREMKERYARENLALRSELADARVILDTAEHDISYLGPEPEGKHDNRCVACARDRRWPVKEGT